MWMEKSGLLPTEKISDPVSIEGQKMFLYQIRWALLSTYLYVDREEKLTCNMPSLKFENINP